MLLGGLAAVLVVALWWLFLFSPGQEELASIEAEIDAAEAEQVSLEQRIAGLEAIRARAPETEAAIAKVQGIVPNDPALAAALRQIVAAAEDAGVNLGSMSTARPSESSDAEALSLFTQPITLSANGSYFQVVDFLRRIEDPAITSRGIVFDDLTIGVAGHPELTVALSGRMFSVLEPVPEPGAEPEAEPAVDEDAEATDATDDDEGAAS